MPLDSQLLNEQDLKTSPPVLGAIAQESPLTDWPQSPIAPVLTATVTPTTCLDPRHSRLSLW